jgi:hypothetical protein
VNDIADATEKILEFTSGMSFEQFERDKKTVYAIVRAFQIIGEAARKIPAEIRQQFATVEWDKMAGMRNRLVHEYFETDLPTVWEAIRNDIPTLRMQMSEVKRQLNIQ